jgi:hypothetical protein
MEKVHIQLLRRPTNQAPVFAQAIPELSRRSSSFVFRVFLFSDERTH